MMNFNERTEFFINDTIEDMINEIKNRSQKYSNDQELTKLDKDLIEREILARIAYAAVKS